MARRGESGQVGVETAIVMPMTIFLILGILQMSMMQQARFLTEYAAFRAVRAGSISQANCGNMLNAAIVGLLPSFSRTDTIFTGGVTGRNLITSYTVPNTHTLMTPMKNFTGVPSLDIVDIQYVVQQAAAGPPAAPYTAQDFDDPGRGLTLVANLTYNYELRIPFADFMIHEMWTGGNYLGGTADHLVPATNATRNTSDISETASRTMAFANDPDTNSIKAKAYAAAKLHRYFVPIRSSYSMRMMSNLPAGMTAGAAGGAPIQACTGSP